MMFLATTDNGFEYVLLDELSQLCSLRVERAFSGRLLFEADRVEGLRALLLSRIVNNFYVLIHYVQGIESLDDIYREVKSIDFTQYIEPTQSFAIRPERIGEHSFTSIDIARVAGQAVIDSYMESKGVRLKVNLDNPDVEVYVELNHDRLLVALAITRESMHKRGYRVFNHPAALKTTIAAAMLRLARWKPSTPIIDPMCGSGTIVIEAALSSIRKYPICMNREWVLNHEIVTKIDPELNEFLAKICSDLDMDVPRVHLGVEINPRFVEGASINAKFAGVDRQTLFIVGDCRHLSSLWTRIRAEIGDDIRVAVFNPPYGERMKPKDLYDLYRSVLRELYTMGIERVVFITSAIEAAEDAIYRSNYNHSERLFVIHGTLPSYVYILEL